MTTTLRLARDEAGLTREALARKSGVSSRTIYDLELPAIGPGRDRIASPEEAARLLAALPEQDRPIWATAMYAGLRRGGCRR